MSTLLLRLSRHHPIRPIRPSRCHRSKSSRHNRGLHANLPRHLQQAEHHLLHRLANNLLNLSLRQRPTSHQDCKSPKSLSLPMANGLTKMVQRCRLSKLRIENSNWQPMRRKLLGSHLLLRSLRQLRPPNIHLPTRPRDSLPPPTCSRTKRHHHRDRDPRRVTSVFGAEKRGDWLTLIGT